MARGGYGRTASRSVAWNPAFGGPIVAKLDLAASSAAKCGDFNGDGNITAGDALGTLRTAVGSATCALNVCDFNGDGSLTASDSLLILRVAVKQPVTPHCPA